MPLFTIDRDCSDLADTERTLAATRALLCSLAYPGMQWVRSYWDDATQHSRCFYVARSLDDILFHARISDISCVAARPVTELRRNSTGSLVLGGVDLNQEHCSDDSLKVFIARLKLGSQSDEAVLASPWPLGAIEQSGWVRSFIDRDVDEIFAVFQTDSPNAAFGLAEQTEFELIALHEATEFFPSDIEMATSPAFTS